MRRLLLLGRPDCHLCEAFEQALREGPLPDGCVVDHACVDDRGEWRMRYGRRIPVLLDEDGRVLAEGVFDPAALSAGMRP
ncbi:glutaredoxin family protein [Sinimarinibacterium thermocellulolyticum]|uniref:Glutaredoxin family protein n=1 Tax=Sinimarinibacterium thermocellulolyticum TaxID=3170016 RepID=A0ABV2A9Y0_9GAMM